MSKRKTKRDQKGGAYDVLGRQNGKLDGLGLPLRGTGFLESGGHGAGVVSKARSSPFLR